MQKIWNRLAKKVKKWSRGLRQAEWRQPSVYAAEFSARFHRSFQLIGQNWQDEPGRQLPVVLMFGFNVWKRESVSQFLPEYRTAYAPMKANFKSIGPCLNELSEKILIVWGYTEPLWLNAYAHTHQIPIFRMEDGFFRSVGLGADHTIPFSLVLDRSGLYLDASQPSDLENLLNQYSFQENPQLLARAQKCLALIREYGVTKYNLVNRQSAINALVFQETRRILVVGQVEDDMSILKGCDHPITNQTLLETALRENPDAQVIYKPHPDVLMKGRLGKIQFTNAPGNLLILEEHFPLPELLACVDHVYTITSLTGFEAILRDIPVTVLGQPFYAGWGLTDDRARIARRTRRLSPLELFAGACLLYPRYKLSRHARPLSLEQSLMEIIQQTRYPQLREVVIPPKSSLNWLANQAQMLLREGNFYSVLGLLMHRRASPSKGYQKWVAELLPQLLTSGSTVQEQQLVLRIGLQLLSEKFIHDCLAPGLVQSHVAPLAIQTLETLLAEDAIEDPGHVMRQLLAQLYSVYGVPGSVPNKPILQKNKIFQPVLSDSKMVARQAFSLLKQCEFDAAEMYFLHLLKDDYGVSAWYEGLAQVASGRLDYEKALFYMQFALAFSQPKERAGRMFRLGELSLKLEKLQDVLVYFWSAAYLDSDFAVRVFGYTQRSNVYSPFAVDYDLFVQMVHHQSHPNLLNLGRCYLNLGQFEEAIQYLEKAASDFPECAQSGIWLAHAYSHVQCYDEARLLFNQVLLTRKNQTLCLREYLRTLIDMGDFDAAGKLLDYANEQDIAVGAEWEIKTYLGLQRIQRGFSAYRTIKLTEVMKNCYPQQYFQSIKQLPAHTNSLLVIALYGPGDEIRWATLYGELRRRFSTVQDIYVTCDPRLEALLQRSFPDLQFIGVKRTGRNLPADEVPLYTQVKSELLSTVLDNQSTYLLETVQAVILMSDLLGDLLTIPNDFPCHTGYLKPDQQYRRYWRERLDQLKPGPKVGINWRSSLTTYNRNDYYIDLLLWDEVLSDSESITFINLQYDDCQQELRLLKETYGHELVTFSELDLYQDFESLAALISELDLVIAPATNIVEIAGAVGCPVWLLSNVSSLHWRVHPETGLDLWHPQLRHIKGNHLRDKASLMKNLAEAFTHWRVAHPAQKFRDGDK